MSAVMEVSEPSAKNLRAMLPPLVRHFELMATAPGGVSRLRELILTLAVQGKLVQQNPNDGPARGLLQQLHAENIRLIADGKIRPGKALKEVAEEDLPFGLPDGWEWVRLGATMAMLNGKAFKPTDWKASGLPIVRIQNLNRIDAAFNYCDETLVPDRNKIDDGSFLISWSGTPGTSFGAFIWRRGPAALNQHIFKCELHGEVFDPEFLRLSINSQLSVLIAQAQGGVGLQHVTKGVLENLVLVLPPLAEQTRIVARVEELMHLCDALEAKGQLEVTQHAQLVQTLLGALTTSATPDELADNWQRVETHFNLLLDRPEAIDALEQTILQLAVRGLLVPQDPNDEPASVLLQKIRSKMERPLAESSTTQGETLSVVKQSEQPFDLPSGWGWVRMGNLIEGGSGTTPLRARTDYFAAGTEMWVKTTDLNNGVVTSCEELITKTAVVENRLKYFPAGTVCVAMYGGAGTIGKSGVLGVASTINQSVFALPPAEGIDSDFLHIYVISVRSKWMSFAAGLRKDPNINGQIIKRMVMPLPPLAEQLRIVARVEFLRRLCTHLRQRLTARQTTQTHLAEALIDGVA